MSDAKPYRVSIFTVERLEFTNGTESFMVLKSGQKTVVSYHPTKAAADTSAYIYESCYLSGAAARDGEVGRLRTALESIKVQAQQIRELPAWPLVEMNNRLDRIKTVARSALAPGNGGEGEK